MTSETLPIFDPRTIYDVDSNPQVPSEKGRLCMFLGVQRIGKTPVKYTLFPKYS